MFEAIGRFAVKFRWVILVVWVAAVPLLAAHLPNISDVSKNNNSDFLPKHSPSTTAVDLETKFQGKDSSGSTSIVAARETGPLTAADEAAINRLAARVRNVPVVTGVKDLGNSADGHARQLQVSLGGEANGPKATEVIKGIRDSFTGLPSGLQVHLAGELAEAIDSNSSNKSGKNNTQLFTVVFILVLLLLVFRAVLAPLVTLIPAGIALAIAQPLIAEATKAGVTVSFVTEILLVVLILGAGTDYGLFLVFRTREELRNGLQPKEAVVKALSRVGESITFSALTVIAALVSLVLAEFGIYHGLGPALAIGLAVMLLAALTFLPALLSILGRAVFWPAKTVKMPLKMGLWGRIADRVIERPVVMLMLGAVLFAALSLGMLGYKTTGFSSGNGAPAGSDSAAGQRILTEHFAAASSSPQLIIFDMNQPVWNDLSVITRAQQELERSGKFKSVSGPFNVNGFKLSPEMLARLHTSTSGQSSPILQAVSQFISSDGKTFQLFAVNKVGTPGSVAAANDTPNVRRVIDQTAHSIGARSSGVFGIDAIGYDINHIASNDLKRIIPVVLVIIGVLLALLLRSLVAPWYLILTVGLSYVATLGFAMLVFVHWGHQSGLNFILPFMLFIFSMALGEDYNILVMSRIREEAGQEASLPAAVTKAVGITGTTVTSAGMILAGTFGVLGLVGGNDQVEQIGYSIAFGILLDTFFVRTLLVPSIVSLLGRYNWWPSKLYRESR